MKTQILKPAIVLAATLLAQTSDASTINYQLQNLGTNNYRYVYTVINDGTLPGGSAIQLFDIFSVYLHLLFHNQLKLIIYFLLRTYLQLLYL